MKIRPELYVGAALVALLVFLLSYADVALSCASHVSDAATGQTVPILWQGATVYVSADDAHFLHYAGYAELCTVATFLLLILSRRFSRRRVH